MPGAPPLHSELNKSSPDRAKLASMTSRTVQVTKIVTKHGPGQTVIPAFKSASMDWIDELPQMLAGSWGPGTYRIEVFEEGGPDKDVWTARLGPVASEETTMPANGSANPIAFPPGPGAPEGLQALGHGFFYNEALGLLTTPTKQVIPWRPGEAFPAGLGPATGAQPLATQWGAPATPWGQPGQGPPGASPWGWGGYPTSTPTEDTTAKRELELIKAQLSDANKRAEDAERRRERDETNARIDKLIDATNARTNALIEEIKAMRAAPAVVGPAPEVEALKVELADQRRRGEDLQREQARALEQQRQQERYETSLRDMNTKFEAVVREMSGSKTDPMITMLTQLMTSQQQSSGEAVRAISESTRAQLEAARSQLATSSLTPEKLMELVRTLAQTSQGTSGEINQGFVNMFQQLFKMSTDMIKLRQDGESAGQPPLWATMAQGALEQVGTIGKLWASTKMREAAMAGAAAAQQQRQVAQQPQRPPQRQMQPRPPQQPAQPPQALAPAAIRDQAAEHVYGPRGADGRPLGRPAPAPAPAEAPAAAPPLPAAPPAAVNGKGARGGKGQRREAPASPPPAPAPPAAGQLAGAPPEPEPEVVPIARISAAELRPIVDQMTDEALFGEALSQVQVLRASVREAHMPAKEVGAAVLASRSYFQAFAITPPSIELLNNGHFDILCDRLLPEQSPAFRALCAAECREQLLREISNNPPQEEEEVDDEEDDDDDEAPNGLQAV